MALLDQIDPDLRHVVEELRKDRHSIYYRGGPRARSLPSEQLRPMSQRASSRRAEAYLIDTFRDEVATWLLRGVFLEWQRLEPLGAAYRCEERRPERLAWSSADVLRSAAGLSSWGLEGEAQPAQGNARRGIGLIDVMGRGEADQQVLLEACALSHALAPSPECGVFATQVLVAQGQLDQALEVASGIEARVGRPDLGRTKNTWLGLSAWRRGNFELAVSRFLAARDAEQGEDLVVVHGNLLIAGLVQATVGADWREFELSLNGAEGALEVGTRWVVDSLREGTRNGRGGLSCLALSRAAAGGSGLLRSLIEENDAQ